MAHRNSRKQLTLWYRRPGAVTLLLLTIILAIAVCTSGLVSHTNASAQKLEAKTVHYYPVSSLESSMMSNLIMGAEEESYFEETNISASSRYARAQAQSKSYHVFHVEFDSARSCARFKVRGAHVFNRYREFADIFIADDKNRLRVFDNLRRAPGIVWVELAGKTTAPPPVSARPGFKIKQPSESIVRGGLQGLTGKGVIIAFIDSGLDFRNPDFITYDSAGLPSSRLLHFLDTTSDSYHAAKLGTKPPISYPNGVPFGTLYSGNQLTAELRSPTSNIPATDLSSHGTAVASVGSGNGNNALHNKYVKGVAPDADIIAVRIGAGQEGELENGYLLNAIVAWLDRIAGDRPLVVSCSFGSLDGGHDGYRIAERQLDARFALNRRGRALVTSAGNDGNNPVHAEVEFTGSDNAGFIQFSAGAPGADLYLYFDSADTKDILVSIAEGAKTKVWVNPLTKQAVMLIHHPEGDGELRLFNKWGKEMKADAYIFNGAFKPGSASYNKLISNPGTAKNAITVTSYDWNDVFADKILKDACHNPMNLGQLSCYSSRGYTRLGGIKPDIAAPGQYYSASYARRPDGSGVNPTKVEVDAAGKYRLFSGTSASTPYTAGVIALLLQKKPTLTLREIKEILHNHSTSEWGLTGDVPNPQWGYGKLDLAAVQRMIKAVD